MLCLKTDQELDEAKSLRSSYLWVVINNWLVIIKYIIHFSSFHRNGTLPPGTTTEQLLAAKQIYESSFHPDTGQKQNVFGRMCFQVPGGMAITGAMLSFYKYFIFKRKCKNVMESEFPIHIYIFF